MQSNIGNRDRTLRIIFAIMLFYIGYNYSLNLTIRIVIFFFAIILIVTTVMRKCPLYSILSFSSKGSGLDKITKRDIEEAVNNYSDKDSKVVDNISPLMKKVTTKTNINAQNSPKEEVVKKTPAKQTTIKKKDTIKLVVKNNSKTKITKKFASKKKKVTPKKTITKKKITKSKSKK